MGGMKQWDYGDFNLHGANYDFFVSPGEVWWWFMTLQCNCF